MKSIIYVGLIAVMGMASAFASISVKKVENAKQSAAKSGKLVSFVFYQAYWDRNCPKCVATVNANNAAAKKISRNKDSVMVEVIGSEKDVTEALPTVVSKDGGTPRIVVTDAECTKVVAELKAGATKEDVEAFEKKLKEARTAKD